MIKPKDCCTEVVTDSRGRRVYKNKGLGVYYCDETQKSYSHIGGYELSQITDMIHDDSDVIEFVSHCGLEAIHILRKGI